MRKVNIKKVQAWWLKYLDQTKMAATGIGWGMKAWRYSVLAGVIAVFFGMLLTMLKSGSTNIKLLAASIPLGEKLDVVGGAFVRMARDIVTIEGFLIVMMAILQGVVVAMLVRNYRQKKRVDSDSLGSTGIVGVLAVLGFGCPACGTSLLVPLLSVVFSSTAYAMIGVVSGVVTAAAFVVGLIALRRLGFLNYIATTAKRYKKARTKDVL